MKLTYTHLAALLLTTLLVYTISRFNNTQTHNGTALYGAVERGEHRDAARWAYQRLHNPHTGEIPPQMRKKELAFAATLPTANNGQRSSVWQNRGPYNLGGRTRALALDVTNENIILAGQVSGGMWRSTNGGAWFTKCTQPQQTHSVTCVAQDTRAGKTNVWYYGTGEHYGIVNAAGFSSRYSGDGIFKSTDGGVSWQLLPSTASGTPTTLYQKRDFDFVWEIVTNHTNTQQDEVLAATVNGIWRSTDGGTTWAPTLGLDTAVGSISEYTDLAITPTGVLYATVSAPTPSKGIWRSTDGVNWVNITPAGFPANYERVEIGIAPSDETKLYFIAYATGSGTTNHALWYYQYLSGDGTGSGGQWSNRTNNIPDDHCLGFYTFDFRKYSSQTSYDMFFAVHPTNPDVVFLGGTNIYRSLDGFTTANYEWIGGYQCDTNKYSNYVYTNHHPDQHRLLFLPSNPNKAISATDGGLMKTDNIFNTPVQWQLLNNGYNTGQFYTCAIEPGNTNSEIIIGGLQDNGTYFTHSLNPDTAWKSVFYGDGAYCAIAHNRSNYYLSWQTGKVFKFDISDNGTVNNLTRIDPTGGSNYLFIAPFILDPADDNRMYLCAGRYIWRNDSLGAIPLTGNEYNSITQGWTRLNGTLAGTGIPAPYNTALDISPANNNILYFGTDQGQVYRLDSCRTNNTATKTNITPGNFPAYGYVSCIDADPTDANKVMACFSNYGIPSIFYTDNGGTTWAHVSGNLEENPDGTGNGPSVNWVHMYNNGSAVTYYAATSTGLYSTTQLNGANTVWVHEGPASIGNVVVNMVTSRPYDGNVVVATHGNGIYSNKTYTPNSLTEVSTATAQCYPNPFSRHTTFALNNHSPINRVSIYALGGSLVAQLTGNGSTTVQWNGHNTQGHPCPTGTYVAVLQYSGNKTAVKKVVKVE